MSTLNVFKTVSMVLVAAVVCVSLRAHATAVNSSLQFIAPGQSIWGPGSDPSQFSYSGSAGFDLPFDLGSENFGYSIGATTGIIMGNVNGSLTTSYTPVLSAPGTANIGLQYVGDPNGGSLTSLIATTASLTVFNQTFGPSFGLNVASGFTPWLGLVVPGITAYDIANPSIDVGVASADLDFGVVQTNFFTPTGIGGTLFYQREGSSLVQSQPFNLADGLSLPVNLSQSGTYDFWFGNDWNLANQFNWSASLGLVANASTIAGCGSDLLESCHWSDTLANPTIYASDPFALNFEGFAQPTSFQIEVQAVPVPDGLGLATLGGGFLLLAVLDGWRRRRARTPDGAVAGNGRFAISGGVAQ